jgi:hypothetical protein
MDGVSTGLRKRFLGDDSLETLFLALDAISQASVRLHRQQRENSIDIALFGVAAALRAIRPAMDMVVNMISVFHQVPRL